MRPCWISSLARAPMLPSLSWCAAMVAASGVPALASCTIDRTRKMRSRRVSWLARKASSIRRNTALASWLHQVAFRVALRMQEQEKAQRLRTREAWAMAKARQVTGAESNELAAILDGELERLPPKYRGPILLCLV